MKKTLSPIALLVAALLALTACGGNTDDSGGSGASSSDGATQSDSSQSTGQHNDADVTFAQNMIPHHQQAVQMAKMAKTQATSADVKDLAAKIEAAQGPEIQQMKGWLKDWGAEPAMGSMGHGNKQDMGGMGHGSVAGMMTAQDMKMLSRASGATFDKLFLTMMIKHHQGAVQMAQTEVSKGQNPDAIAMAKQIISSQQAEIDQMRQMLAN